MNKTYAVSDLHGMYNLWEKINNYIDDSDTIYFLGDAADRGPDGLKLMMELLADKRVIYLYGNHEDIMCREAFDAVNGLGRYIWYSNGGEPTAVAFDCLSKDGQNEILRRLSRLPREATYVNKYDQVIFMCHAGTNPGCDERYWKFKGEEDAYIWNREHFLDKWIEGYENYFIVHGHTPAPLLQTLYFNNKNTNIEIARYADNHKIDIDCGCFATGKVALLDLDTLEPIYFIDEQMYNEYMKEHGNE